MSNNRLILVSLEPVGYDGKIDSNIVSDLDINITVSRNYEADLKKPVSVTYNDGVYEIISYPFVITTSLNYYIYSSHNQDFNSPSRFELDKTQPLTMSIRNRTLTVFFSIRKIGN